jgi:hypothetical protein
MRFKLVRTGKSYSATEAVVTGPEGGFGDAGKTASSPVMGETGSVSHIKSLIILTEAELILATSQLAGDHYCDWHILNRMWHLNTKMADLKRWLCKAQSGRLNRRDQP